MAGRRCFMEDKFISVQSCEVHQALKGVKNCRDCEYIGSDPGVTTPALNSKETACGGCGRPGLSKPGRGLCGACYTAALKKEKEVGQEITAKPTPPARPVKEAAAALEPPIKDYEEAEEHAAKISATLELMAETPGEPRDYSVLINLSIVLLGFGWVIALYWLSGEDFTRGRELAGAFSVASIVGGLAAWLRR